MRPAEGTPWATAIRDCSPPQQTQLRLLDRACPSRSAVSTAARPSSSSLLGPGENFGRSAWEPDLAVKARAHRTQVSWAELGHPHPHPHSRPVGPTNPRTPPPTPDPQTCAPRRHQAQLDPPPPGYHWLPEQLLKPTPRRLGNKTHLPGAWRLRCKGVEGISPTRPEKKRERLPNC